MMEAPLKVENLKTYYETGRGSVKAVDGVDLTLEGGLSLGVAGESGCGKSTLGYSLINLIPPPGKIVEGRILVEGEDITKLSEDELRRRIRWRRISMIFQGAMNSLNPFYTIGSQMAETIAIHKPELERRGVEELIGRSLELVGLGTYVKDMYPHELSGGMKQRAVIAMGLMMEPKIVIADEPTTALDVIAQASIIGLLKDLQTRVGMDLILITHDLSIISELTDHLAIMYAGKIIEYGALRSIYTRQRHPYTHGLTASIPRLRDRRPLKYIPGAPPDLRNPPPGCRFHPRCPYAIHRCRVEEPGKVEVERGHYVWCHRAEEELW
ncbi:MAG: ABC transporter ATP-binding protein [Candidatus Bathyarchaeia archaeon]|nr:ABC transporter ATP-binding protein [Candidatus Bathyarchaeota archaeon]